MPGSNEYSISPVLTAKTGTGTGTGTEATSTLVAKSAATPTSDLTTDYRKSALQNSEHDNWRDAYAEYSGKNGSWKDRREFKKAWKSGENVRERVGAETYDQLRQQEELEQFGTQGFGSGSEGEQNRFNRRFNRQLRNGRLNLPTTPAPTAPVSQGQNSVIYPWNWDTYQIRPRGGLFSQSFMRTSYFPGAGAGAGAGNNPELKPKTDWNAIAAEKLGEGKTMQDVIALQKQMGITADGKWGKQTQAAYDAMQKDIENMMTLTPDSESKVTYFDINGASPLIKHSVYNPNSTYTDLSKPIEQPIIQQNSNQFSGEKTYSKMGLVTDFDNWYIKSLGNNVPMRGSVINYEKLHGDPEYQKSFNSFKSQYVDTGWGGGKNRFVRVEDYQSIPKQFDENGQLTQEYKDYITNERAKAYMISRKQGGKMNKIKYFQQGGQMQQQDPKQQITQLVQAAMQGDEQATQQINQVFEAAKQGDQQAQQIAQMIQQVVQELKGQATIAKWGSKLGYIKSLKYAKGGKTCLSCQNGGKPLETSPVNKSLKKPIKKVEEKACGGKTKKR